MEELIRRFDKLNNFLQAQGAAQSSTLRVMDRSVSHLDRISGKLSQIQTAIQKTNSILVSRTAGGASSGTGTATNMQSAMDASLNDLTKTLRALNTTIQANNSLMQRKEAEGLVDKEKQKANMDPARKSFLGDLRVDALIGALVASVHQMQQTFNSLRQTGLTSGQSWTQLVGTIKNTFHQFLDARKSGSYISPIQEAKLREEIASRMVHITPGRLQSMSRIQGVTQDAQSAVALQRTLERTVGLTPKAVEEFVELNRHIAKLKGLAPGQVMRTMAENAEMFARATNRSGNAMLKFIDRTAKLNINPGDINQFATNITSDFGNFLDMQSKLQVIMPGVDLMGTAMAAQFGSLEDVTRELEKAFKGRDVGQLPLSLMTQISGGMGLSPSALVSLSRGETLEDKKATEQEKKNTDTEADRRKEGNMDFLKSVFNFAATVAVFAGAIKIFASGIGGLFGVGALGRGGAGIFSKMGRGLKWAGRGIGGLIGLGGGAAATTTATGLESAAATAGIAGAGATSAIIGGVTTGIVGALGLLGGGLIGEGINHLTGGPTLTGMWKDRKAIKKIREGTQPEIDRDAVAQSRGFYNYDAMLRYNAFLKAQHAGGPQRFHTGGMVRKKLHSEEVPAILQHGEMVLSKVQLAGLTKLMEGVSALGSLGDVVNQKLAGISFPRVMESVKSVFGGMGSFVKQIGSLGSSIMGAGSSLGGGILSKATGLLGSLGESGIGKTISGAIGSIGGLFSSAKSGIMGSIGGLLGGSGGGILGGISGLLGGGSGGGILSGISGLLGGKGIASAAGSVLGGSGISSLLGGLAGGPVGILGTLAAPLLNKIPGVGAITGGISKLGGGVVGKIGSFIGGVFGHPKDKERMQRNADYYRKAMGGDTDALNTLKYMSGRFGEGTVKAGVASGWATQKTRNDAYKKYQQVLSAYGGTPPMATLENVGPSFAQTQDSELTSSVGGVPSRTAAGAMVEGTGNDQVISKLDELISIFRSGNFAVNVSMDGKRVGNTLAKTFSRGSG